MSLPAWCCASGCRNCSAFREHAKDTMTDHETKILALFRTWQALDELDSAQTATLEKTRKARDSAWSEFLYAARVQRGEVLR